MRPKAYSYLTDGNDENENAKVTKKCVIKRKLRCEDYTHSLKAPQLENTINQLEKYEVDVDTLRENLLKSS